MIVKAVVLDAYQGIKIGISAAKSSGSGTRPQRVDRRVVVDQLETRQ